MRGIMGPDKGDIKEIRLLNRIITWQDDGIRFEAAWVNPDHEDEFVWMRSFASARARECAIEAYYGSPEWLAIVGRIRPLIRRREVRVLKRSR